MNAALQDNDSLVRFRVGPVWCCAPSGPVRAVIMPPTLTRPPGVSAAEPGIFRHGGVLVRVNDLRERFGVRSEARRPGRVIIVTLGDRHTGFWVDEILDVNRSPDQGWGPLPPLLPRGVFSRTLTLNTHIHLFAEFDRLDTLHGNGYLRDWIAALETKPAAAGTAAPPEPRSTSPKPTPESRPELRPARPRPPVTDSARTPRQTATPTDTADTATAPPPSTPPSSATDATPHKPSSAASHARNRAAASAPTAPSTKAAATAPTVATGPGARGTKSVSVALAGIPARRTASVGGARESGVTGLTPPAASMASPTPEKVSTPVSAPLPTHGAKPPDWQADAGGGGLIVAALLVLMGVLAGGIYWLTGEHAAPATTRLASTPPGTAHTYSGVPPAEYPGTEPATAPEPLLPVAEPPSPEEAVVETPETPPAPDSSGTDAPVADAGTAPPHAAIERDAEGIVITVTGPLHEVAGDTPASTMAEPATPTGDATGSDVESDPAAAASASAGGPPALAAAADGPLEAGPMTATTPSSAPPAVTEIVHIVVRGDTLWAIAERYVKDPFRYPELARLSQIDNPDRIYPGDRVRIRYRPAP